MRDSLCKGQWLTQRLTHMAEVRRITVEQGWDMYITPWRKVQEPSGRGLGKEDQSEGVPSGCDRKVVLMHEPTAAVAVCRRLYLIN